MYTVILFAFFNESLTGNLENRPPDCLPQNPSTALLQEDSISEMHYQDERGGNVGQNLGQNEGQNQIINLAQQRHARPRPQTSTGGLIFNDLKSLDTGSSTSSSNSIDMASSNGLIYGRQVIKSYSLQVDGDYKMIINFNGIVPLIFDNLVVGNCKFFSSAVVIKGVDTETPEINIDINRCQDEQFSSFESLFGMQVQDTVASLLIEEFLNKPITITFDILDNEDRQSVISKYRIQGRAEFSDRYGVSYNHITGKSKSSAFNSKGVLEYIEGNLQWRINLYDESDLHNMHMGVNAEKWDLRGLKHQTSSSYHRHHGIDHFDHSSLARESINYAEIVPSNGFNNKLLTSLPENCFIRDLKSHKNIRLWSMKKLSSKNKPICYEGIAYNIEDNSWTFTVDFMRVAGSVNFHKSFVLYCDVRVCGNLEGNYCGRVVEDCGYDGGRAREVVVPTVPMVLA